MNLCIELFIGLPIVWPCFSLVESIGPVIPLWRPIDDSDDDEDDECEALLAEIGAEALPATRCRRCAAAAIQ